MEQLKLELDAELARFLNKRAHELRSTPDVLVSSLLTHWLRIAHEQEPLGSDETVQDRMAKIAEHYADESRGTLEDDPDLGLDAANPSPGAAEATVQEQALPRGSGDEEPTAQMSDAEIRQAFAEIAENYEEISREVFGDEPPLSADLLPERFFVAYRVAIPEKPQSANWTSALMERIERILMLRLKKRPTEPSPNTLQIWLPRDARIDGPTLLFVEPDPVRSELSTAADQ
ncbi:MAG: hypothetical protein OXM54_01715 [Acidimicrobiaceae bacterium]|nr:hypothetical protein [Acidimicrobiaceae bacterium]